MRIRLRQMTDWGVFRKGLCPNCFSSKGFHRGGVINPDDLQRVFICVSCHGKMDYLWRSNMTERNELSGCIVKRAEIGDMKVELLRVKDWWLLRKGICDNCHATNQWELAGPIDHNSALCRCTNCKATTLLHGPTHYTDPDKHACDEKECPCQDENRKYRPENRLKE